MVLRSTPGACVASTVHSHQSVLWKRSDPLHRGLGEPHLKPPEGAFRCPFMGLGCGARRQQGPELQGRGKNEVPGPLTPTQGGQVPSGVSRRTRGLSGPGSDHSLEQRAAEVGAGPLPAAVGAWEALGSAGKRPWRLGPSPPALRGPAHGSDRALTTVGGECGRPALEPRPHVSGHHQGAGSLCPGAAWGHVQESRRGHQAGAGAGTADTGRMGRRGRGAAGARGRAAPPRGVSPAWGWRSLRLAQLPAPSLLPPKSALPPGLADWRAWGALCCPPGQPCDHSESWTTGALEIQRWDKASTADRDSCVSNGPSSAREAAWPGQARPQSPTLVSGSGAFDAHPP